MSRDDLVQNERAPSEIYTRVMGYHRPVSWFNPGKQSEFAERKYFEEHVARYGGDERAN